jgi:hypothetical protein
LAYLHGVRHRVHDTLRGELGESDVPPAGVNLIALDKRLMMICLNRSGSPVHKEENACVGRRVTLEAEEDA